MSTTAEREALTRIAEIAHEGGLAGMSEWDALNAIRRLSLPYSKGAPQPSEPRATDSTAEREALAWYAEHVAGCRKLGSIGDPHRQLLDNDGGARARAALAQPPAPQAEAPAATRAAEMLAAYAELIKATGAYAEMHYIPAIEFVIQALRAPPAPKGLTDEREAFKQWIEHEYCGGLNDAGEWDERRNCYVDFPTHVAWKAWQARSILAHTSPAKGEAE